MRTLIPKKLPKGATIGLVAPASPLRDVSRLHRGVRYLESLGYHVKLGKSVTRVFGGYLAGTDQERAHDVQSMFEDPQVQAIFCTRGGYGSARLLPLLNFERIRKNPKIFVGFSDITAVSLALWQKCRLVTFSGAMPAVDMWNGFDPLSEEYFWRVITSTKPLGVLRQPWPLTPIQRGSANAILLGGNLSVLTSLIGTPYMPSLKGAILALEDVGEETYRIDRMITQLSQSVHRHAPVGVVYGYWSQSTRRGTTPHRDIIEVLSEHTHLTEGPILSELMYGHESTKFTLPLGVQAHLSSRTRSLKIMEGAVR